MRSAIPALLVIGLAACGGGDDGDTLSEQQATQAFGSMQVALGDVGEELEGQGTTGSVDVTASCAGGGSVSAEGQWTSGDSFALDVAFHSCRAQDVTIDGELSYAGSATSSGASVDISGRVTFSGAVNGTCNIDLSLDFSSGLFQVSGSMCGLRLDRTINN